MKFISQIKKNMWRRAGDICGPTTCQSCSLWFEWTYSNSKSIINIDLELCLWRCFGIWSSCGNRNHCYWNSGIWKKERIKETEKCASKERRNRQLRHINRKDGLRIPWESILQCSTWMSVSTTQCSFSEFYDVNSLRVLICQFFWSNHLLPNVVIAKTPCKYLDIISLLRYLPYIYKWIIHFKVSVCIILFFCFIWQGYDLRQIWCFPFFCWCLLTLSFVLFWLCFYTVLLIISTSSFLRLIILILVSNIVQGFWTMLIVSIL